MLGATFGILIRKDNITLPSRKGRTIKLGTLGQYLIAFVLSFFFQGVGIPPVMAGFYATSGSSAGNMAMKIVANRLEASEVKQLLKEAIHKAEVFAYDLEVAEETKETKIHEMIVDAQKDRFSEIKTLVEAVGYLVAKKEEIESESEAEEKKMTLEEARAIMQRRIDSET